MTEEKKPGRPAKVDVIAVRKFGMSVPVSEKHPDGVRMVNVGEQVSVPRTDAQKLQEASAIKVVI